jgi:hypothetical protein
MGPARRMIILFFPTGLAFESCEIGVFFTEMLNRFSQEKNEESWNQRELCPKQEFRDRTQGSSEDTREYYAKKRKLWVKTYTPRNRSLVEFKDVMIKGLNDEELKETCIFFMPENCTTAGNRDRCNVRSPTIL